MTLLPENARRPWSAEDEEWLRQFARQFGTTPEACQRAGRELKRTPSGVYMHMLKLGIVPPRVRKVFSNKLVQFVIDNYPTNPKWTAKAIAKHFKVDHRDVIHIAVNMLDMRRPKMDKYKPTQEERVVIHKALVGGYSMKWLSKEMGWPLSWVRYHAPREFPLIYQIWVGRRKQMGKADPRDRKP